MTFRAKVFAALAIAAALPLALLAMGIRRQLTHTLTTQYEGRVASLAAGVREGLEEENAAISRRLAAVTRALASDDRARLALVHGAASERAYVLDYAVDAMRKGDLDLLQIQDDDGRIVSSGHFRNEFDRLDPALPRLLATAGGNGALIRARTPEGSFVALARTDSVRIGTRRFTVVGGIAMFSATLNRLASAGDIVVALATPGDTVTSVGAVYTTGGASANIPLAYFDTRSGDTAVAHQAALIISHSRATIDALRRDVTRWVYVAVAVAAVLALSLAAWLSALLDRLRAGTVTLRDAERRATVGDMARQVNHDIKNGLVPIRNVMRHLIDVEERTPSELPAIFRERRATLDSSIEYLDALARNYARLTPRIESRAMDVNAVVRDVAQSASAGGVRVQTSLAAALPATRGDAVVLRRIVDNLVRNALDSLDGHGGTVSVATARGAGGGVRIVVNDTGRGMTQDQLAHATDDFFTTREGGTGLGLSVVRRLTADLNASLKIESAPKRGTTVTVELPAHD